MSSALPHNKKPRKQYVLGDFVKYATGIFAAHFVAISDMGIYEFAEKQYTDEKQQLQTCHMVLVGHYARKSGGPPVWAQATGDGIRYHKGTGFLVEPLILDIHCGKVYYEPPFSYIGGTIKNSDTPRGMTQERKFQRAVVESAIHFVFLLSGRLNQTLDITNPDLLGHFKIALVNLLQNRKAHEAADRTPTKRSPTRVEETAITKNEARPFKVSETNYRNLTFQIIRRPLPPIIAASLNRRVIDLTRDVPGSSPQAFNERILLEQQFERKPDGRDYEISAEDGLQRQALKAKVSAKRQRLAQCEATALEHRLQIAVMKEELAREKEELAREKEELGCEKEELGCEKKAKMFWEHKHNSLPRILLDRSRLSIASGSPNDQESSVALVRTSDAGVRSGPFGSGRSRPL
ncbi:hypothetical protein COCVIDRAFT_26461 [Bipolaris victoriae FI3]|uniref:Uncharacterized protein n=1 Tax=Bipolaris victoriae (strain FI3) TaxID=930091 RepID=W7EA06_BIPV3|nr:hypothetical protein COCVIDRAFT_26461 [Bipolaris victoriae FI3]